MLVSEDAPCGKPSRTGQTYDEKGNPVAVVGQRFRIFACKNLPVTRKSSRLGALSRVPLRLAVGD